MKKISRQILTGERALFASRDLTISECVFEDGESPLKESKNIALSGSIFRWKYPLWYGENITLQNCAFTDTGRAGVWYTKNITFTDCVIEAPKTFRRCNGLALKNVSLPNAAETLWNCQNVTLKNVTANGHYFAMNCQNVEAENLTLTGDYCFDGAKNIVIKNAKLLSKDSFWNSENVTVYDSFISGEYLGWNAKNLTLINCTIESLQGFCYIENLKLVNCRLVNTTLAFEYSPVDAVVEGKIDSVKNPSGGKIVAGSIDELIMEPDKVDISQTEIIQTDKK
jgi:hypothetical protein